jgi:heme-NO-binding protein
MHGLIVNQLRQFIVDAHGRDMWTSVNEQAHLSLSDRPRIDRVYDDANVLAAIRATAELTSTPPQELLAAFGEFLAPTLLRVYSPMLNSGWRTLDVVEHTEEHIHTAIRLRDRSAAPPYLRSARLSADSVVVHYTSPRQLCAVAEGIVRGIAAYFGESVTITQERCMLRGDTECMILVQAEASGASA